MADSRLGAKAVNVENTPDLPVIWIKISTLNTIVGCVYRQISSSIFGNNQRGESFQREQLDLYLSQFSLAQSMAKHVIIGEDMNLLLIFFYVNRNCNDTDLNHEGKHFLHSGRL